MTQDIRIAHQGAERGSEAVTRRAILEDKDQTDGLGVRGLAVLFIGFAVYLKSFFSPSQAENTGSAPDQPGPAEPAESGTANRPAPLDAEMAAEAAHLKRDSDDSATPDTGQLAEVGLPTLVALMLPPMAEDSLTAAIPSNPGTGNIARNPALPLAEEGLAGDTTQPTGAQSDTSGSMKGGVPEASPPVSVPGQDGASDTNSPPALNVTDSPPNGVGIYDIADLFQDLGSTLHDRADSLVDRVTDLAIGDLMRDLTLGEFRAHLGTVPPNPGRPLETLVSVLNDAGSRDAFLDRNGMTGWDVNDPATATPSDGFHHPAPPEPDSGPDLFI